MIREDDFDEETSEPTTSVHKEEEAVILISKPELSSQSTIDENIISLDHSFGYDCKKMYNLVLIDSKTLVFASGNLIHFFDIESKTVHVRRSACGGGIGCISKNPVYKQLLTVAENGNRPTIFIYKYPEMEIQSTLLKGTKLQYSMVDYTADGELLASQGGSPDFMLTIWDWKRGEIKLRTKSFSNDVVNLMFSPYIPEQLTTCGLGHIKFWKMSQTFTGLKLQGLIGRFGKTEICDIYGMCPLPDEKILSGCEWGNVLVWEGGLVKMEVCRKNRRPCHNGPITQIFMCNNEEVMTVGSDGFIRIWYWETVELSDPAEDDRVVEIEPSHEFRIGTGSYSAQLLKVVKSEDENNESAIWYAQDGNGGLWWCDLSTIKRPLFPRQLFRCHAGEIVACDTSSVASLICTLGDDGRIYIYNYLEKNLIFHHQFLAPGCDMIWLPVSVDPTASILVIGFADGVLRIVSFNDKELEIQFIQVIKCHCNSITKISMNPKQTILVSASDDLTIFVHQIARSKPFPTLLPIGFIRVDSPVTCINWDSHRWSTGVFGCRYGDFIEVDIPEQPQAYERNSYYLANVPVKRFKFKSIKSSIKRNEQIKELESKKEQKRRLKLKELERIKRESPDEKINEEEFLAESDDEETLKAIHIPDPPNKILWIQYTKDGTFWLSLDGYDAGYVYEYCKESGELLSYTKIPSAENDAIYSFIHRDEYCIFGMSNGKIRINRMSNGNWRDLSNYWVLSMHDNFFGSIPALRFSYDNKFLFSIGTDGNLFAYNWNLPVTYVQPSQPTPIPKLVAIVRDIDDPKHLSLEQQKEQENEEQQLKYSADKKDKVLATIAKLRKEFEEIMMKNSQLPESQRLTPADLALDDRIIDDLQQKLDIQMDIVRRQKEFDFEKAKLAGKKLMEHFIEPIIYPIEVIGIKNGLSVFSFRIKKLGKEFYNLKEEVEEKLEAALKKKRMLDTIEASIRTLDTESAIPTIEPFLIGLNVSNLDAKLESKMRRLLNKYRERKAKELARKKEWETVHTEHPNPDMDHPSDIKMMDEAKRTIGDYKLKSDADFEASDEQRETVVSKLQEIVKTREDAFNIKNNYNTKIFNMREKKKELYHYVQRKMSKLSEIHLEIPESQRVTPDISVTFNFDREFPERNLDLRKYLTPETYVTELMESASCRTATLTPFQIAEKNLIELQRNVLQPCPSVDVQTKFGYQVSDKISLKLLKKLDSVSVDGKATELSDWENELMNLRTRRRIFEQKKIIDKINARIVEFDEEIAQLSEERYDVEVKAKFKEIFLLTLNQELMILKDFEPMEEILMDDVERKGTEVKQLSLRLSNLNAEVEIQKRMIEDLQDLCKKIEIRFKSHLIDNKFAAFLRKIFSRHLTEVDHHENDETEDNSAESQTSSALSTSSSSSTISTLSKDVKMKKLDESICPKGCERKLYDLTFKMRRERHEHERIINGKQKDLEAILMDYETLNQKLEKSKADYEKYRSKLSSLRHQKQTLLNDVDTIVMLKMDQMQYFKNPEEFIDIDNTLLFNKQNVMRLYSRVNKLADETIEAKRSHRINVVHLAKMKTDIQLMEKQIVDLKDSVNQAMLKKFGRVIDLNEVEETILRRFAFEMQIEIRSNAEDIKKQYFSKINELKRIRIDKQKELSRVLQGATEKLNILTVLEEERNFLNKIISMQTKKKEMSTLLHQQQQREEIGSDLDKLKEISYHQKEQIEMLQREIRALSLKTKSFVDARQEYDTLDYSIRQLHGECRPFEDSICSNVDESIMSSTRASSPDEVFIEMLKAVKKFLSENFKFASCNDRDVENIAMKISKYVHQMTLEFNSSSDVSDEMLSRVIERFKSFLPSSAEILNENKISSFIAQILKNINEDVDENHIEILREIINNTIESANQTAISSNSYLQHLLTEIFKMIIITLRVPEDIGENECITEISIRLSRLNGVSTRHVVIEEILEDILDYAVENLEEGIDADLLKKILQKIIEKL